VAVTASINNTNDTIQQSTANYSLLESGGDRVIAAERPNSGAKSPDVQNLAAGVVGGLLLGLAIAYGAIQRRRVIDPTQAAMTLGAPLLGTISKDRRLRKLPGLADLAEDSRLGNELKVLSSSLVLSARRRGLGSIVVTSAHRREGKSVLTRNLAAAAEYIGQPVALATRRPPRSSTCRTPRAWPRCSRAARCRRFCTTSRSGTAAACRSCRSASTASPPSPAAGSTSTGGRTGAGCSTASTR
jgi:hypothetical protein